MNRLLVAGMNSEKQINQWRKHRRQSIRVLPRKIACATVLAAGLLGLRFWVAIPAWFVVVVLGLAGLSVAGEVINIVYLGRKLRSAGQEK